MTEVLVRNRRGARAYAHLGYKHRGVRALSAGALILAGLVGSIFNLGDVINFAYDHPKAKIIAQSAEHLKFTIQHSPLSFGNFVGLIGTGTVCALLVGFGIAHALRKWEKGHDLSYIIGGAIAIGTLSALLFASITGSITASQNPAPQAKASWVQENFTSSVHVPDPEELWQGSIFFGKNKEYPAVFSGIDSSTKQRQFYEVQYLYNSNGSSHGYDISEVTQAKAKALKAAYDAAVKADS